MKFFKQEKDERMFPNQENHYEAHDLLKCRLAPDFVKITDGRACGFQTIGEE